MTETIVQYNQVIKMISSFSAIGLKYTVCLSHGKNAPYFLLDGSKCEICPS